MGYSRFCSIIYVSYNPVSGNIQYITNIIKSYLKNYINNANRKKHQPLFTDVKNPPIKLLNLLIIVDNLAFFSLDDVGNVFECLQIFKICKINLHRMVSFSKRKLQLWRNLSKYSMKRNSYCCAFK